MTAGRPRRLRGFSLLELLVAMAVMAMSLAMLYQVDAGVLRGVADYATQQRATVLAQSLLDARDAVPAAGWREQGQDAGFDWAVSSAALPLPPGLNAQAPVLHEVRIAVRWRGREGPRELELTTLLPQALPLPAERAP
jgi:general secretion pathway protein I